MSANKSILICQCCERGLLDSSAVSDLCRAVGQASLYPESLCRLDKQESTRSRIREACPTIWPSVNDITPMMSGQAVVVPDLCKAALENDAILETIASSESPVIYACHPRAVKALFEFAGHPLPATTEFINLRTHSRTPAPPHSHTPTPPHFHTSSPPVWFPVIDEARCSRCGQCFEFCLFGVYEKDDEGRVRVAHPQNCKNNCPACARICPETAIIFPKVGESPINGAEVTDDEERKANIQINVDKILGSDVYAALNARKQKRRALFDQKKIERALEERKTCSEGNT